jgi:hypothetical protein
MNITVNHHKTRGWGNPVFLAALIIFTVCSAFLALVPNGPARAEALPETSITVSPVKNVLELAPGSEYDGDFVITNTGADAFDFTLSVSPYSVANDSYESNFKRETPRTQISRWISFEKPGYHLEKGEEVKVSYHVSIPADVPSGGQYAVIMAETGGSPSGSGAINTLQRVGMLVFAHIDGGDTREEGRAVSQSIRQFYWSPPVTAVSRLENTGNVDFNATYKFTAQTLFGKTVYDETKQYSLLPDTTRNVEMVWDGAPILGVFRVTQEITLLDETFTLTKTVLILPIWALILILILLAAISFTITAAVKRKRGKRIHKRIKRL